MHPFDVVHDVVFPPERGSAEVARVGEEASVRHGVVFQSLRVGVGLPAIAAGVGLISCVAQLVSFHDGLWVGRYGHYQNVATETSQAKDHPG